MPTGPDYPTARVEILFTSLIHTLLHSQRTSAPGLRHGGRNGVEVVLFVTGSTGSLFIDLAQESYYEDLLAAGVIMHRYRDGFLHSKHLSIDGEIAIVGSSNMDQRSFELNAEVTLIAYDRSAIAALAAIEADYLTKSEPLRGADWRRRPFLRKVTENVMRLVSPLL